MGYEAAIGLEIHVELSTRSKLFCGCAVAFGAEPNSLTCPVCLGLPGSLPILNREAVEYGIRAALALNVEVAGFSKFDRKNYFYPDLPKGYQISQYDLPLGRAGHLDLDLEDGGTRRVCIRRVHLEEDAGKLLHEGAAQARVAEATSSLVDHNRCGVPLLEIVTEPDFRSPTAARAFLEELRSILQYTGVSDCKLEEGSLRVDCNVSVRPAGTGELGTPVELKNLGSFRAVQRALGYEIERQIAVLEGGSEVRRETRHWDEARNVSVPGRVKETADDYRYFPDPDLVPLVLDPTWVERIRRDLPEMPRQRQARFVQDHGLSPYDARVLTTSPAMARFYEETVALGVDPKQAANWIMGELFRYLNVRGLEPEDNPLTPRHLADLITMVEQATISGKIAKAIFDRMCDTKELPEEIVRREGLSQIVTDEVLLPVIDEVLDRHVDVVADYRAGKERALGFLVGQVMKATRGRANPQVVNRLLTLRLQGD